MTSVPWNVWPRPKDVIIMRRIRRGGARWRSLEIGAKRLFCFFAQPTAISSQMISAVGTHLLWISSGDNGRECFKESGFIRALHLFPFSERFFLRRFFPLLWQTPFFSFRTLRLLVSSFVVAIAGWIPSRATDYPQKENCFKVPLSHFLRRRVAGATPLRSFIVGAAKLVARWRD